MEMETVPQVQKMDIAIESSMAESTVRVELFNNQRSQTRVFNPDCNDYHPMVNTASLIALVPGTDTYAYLSFIGAFNAFTDAAAPIVPVTSPNIVNWDELGNLIYQPGYVGGELEAGNIKISSQQSNYRHVFDTSGVSAFLITKIRMTVPTTITDQISQSLTYVKYNVTGSSNKQTLSADTYKTENQQQPNIVTVPVNLVVNPKSGFWFDILPKGVNDAGDPINNKINLSVFFIPKSKSMLSIL